VTSAESRDDHRLTLDMTGPSPRCHTHGMQTNKRRVRVTVTLSPRLLKLVDERASHREDRSRSATIESMLTQAALEEQVKAYYSAVDEVRDADEAFWGEVGRVSASLEKKEQAAMKPRKPARRTRR